MWKHSERGTVEEQYRLFLLVTAAFLFVGTVVELWFAEHLESVVQGVPFVLCGIGFCAVLAAFQAPRRPVLLALRGIMGLMVLGSLYGIYEHLAHNLAFELEVRPGKTAGDVFWVALSGASPLLAPGILALAALLAGAATYRHPALRPPPEA
jgi:hypothetical protein